CRTSSSQTKSAGAAGTEGVDAAVGVDGANGAEGAIGAKRAGLFVPAPPSAGPLYPRAERNSSIRRARTSAEMPDGAAAAGSFGNPATSRFRNPPIPRFPDSTGLLTIAGVVSYARRLILIRCLGEMLSDVMFPPQPPQPSVIAGSRPVVNPID